MRVADRSSNVPVDGDLVDSSNSLPALPTFGSARTPVPANPISTPRSHQRSSSSIYYTAAWGSPYTTPSPKRSADRRYDSSKVVSAYRTLNYYKSERERWLSDGSEDSEGPRRRARIAARSSGSWLDLHSDNDQAVNVSLMRSPATGDSAPAKSDPSVPTY